MLYYADAAHSTHNTRCPPCLVPSGTRTAPAHRQWPRAGKSERGRQCLPAHAGSATLLASPNLIYIFKEAMANVLKHSGATEVLLKLVQEEQQVTFALQDNGRWVAPAEARPTMACRTCGTAVKNTTSAWRSYPRPAVPV